MLKINQLKIRCDEDQSTLRATIVHKLHINDSELLSYKILKRNIDARDKEMIFYTYSVLIEVKNEKYVLNRKNVDVSIYEEKSLPPLNVGIKEITKPIIIVGFGPAGLFCALTLVRNNYPVIVLERGKAIEERDKDINEFITNLNLNEDSNIQFGEGGAGTYSDGKLTARSKDLRVKKIYETLVEFGAEEEILYESYPHLGSDKLKIIIPKIREEIIRLGGIIHYSSRVDELLVNDNDHIIGVKCNDKVYDSNHVVLALGNSARDSFINFNKQGLYMENKPFALGFRIEHHQKMIDEALYHKFASLPSLHAASYRLTHQCSDKRGTYTFCMCPGGEVVAATSSKEQLCVNGMSDYARDKENANSAVLVQVNEEDYGTNLFDGMFFQEKLEKAAYIMGGSNYKAPVQLVKDFINNETSTQINNVKPSYPIGYQLSNLNELLPENLCNDLKEGLISFNHKIKGFTNDDAIITAVETRTSSPIRILRNSEHESISIKGVYPSGEGSGYAGGIVSSAIDGMKTAEKIIEMYCINK